MSIPIGQATISSLMLVPADIGYTSFDVFPTKITIPAGTKDTKNALSSVLNWSEDDIANMSKMVFTGLTYTNAVEAENKLVLYFESFYTTDSDIVIDFGDGSPLFNLRNELLKPIPSDTIDNVDIDGIRSWRVISQNWVTFKIQHTYAKSMKFNVKIYGSRYHTIRAFNYSDGYFTTGPQSNLVCRFLEGDLPIHDCVKNMSSFASSNDIDHANTRLLKVAQGRYYNIKNMRNFSGIFGRCSNLLDVQLGDFILENSIESLQGMFYDDINLSSTNAYLAPCKMAPATGYNHTFYNCKSLKGNISSFFKPNFSYSNTRMLQTFFGCQALSGDVPAERLWLANDQTLSGSGTFSGCRSLQLSQIPVEFGGTGGDIQKLKIHDINESMLNLCGNVATNMMASADVELFIDRRISYFSDFTTIQEIVDPAVPTEHGLSNIPPTIDVQSGHYISINGNVVDRNSSYISEKIYNFGLKKCIKYTNIEGIQNIAYALAAFDKDDNIIKEKSLFFKDGAGSGSLIYFDGTFTFDKDVAYIIFGISHSALHRTQLELGNSVEKIDILSSVIDNLSVELTGNGSSAIDAISAELQFDSFNETPYSGEISSRVFISRTNGTATTFNSGSATHKILLDSVKGFKVTAQAYSSACIGALYNEAGVFLSSFGVKPSATVMADALKYADELIEVSSLLQSCPTAKYVAFSTVTGQLKVILLTLQKIGIQEKVTIIDSNIEQISSIASTTNNDNDFLYGKKYVAFGDSYTWLAYTNYVDENGLSGVSSDAYDDVYRWMTYPACIAKRHNMKLYNGARTGSATFDPTDLYASSSIFAKYFASTATLSNEISSADYITISYGLNDYGNIVGNSSVIEGMTRQEEIELWQNSMGTSADFKTTTLFGAYNVALSGIFTLNPDVKIGIIIQDSWMSKAVHDTMQQVAQFWGIPCLDLKNDPQIPFMFPNPKIGATANGATRYDYPVCKALAQLKFNEFNYQAHPNPKCHKLRSTIIEQFLKTL